MIEIKLSDSRVKRAADRAKARKCHVSMGVFGWYVVRNDKNKNYYVNFVKRGDKALGDCTCSAGRSGQICYHLVSALPVHAYAARNRA